MPPAVAYRGDELGAVCSSVIGHQMPVKGAITAGARHLSSRPAAACQGCCWAFMRASVRAASAAASRNCAATFSAVVVSAIASSLPPAAKRVSGSAARRARLGGSVNRGACGMRLSWCAACGPWHTDSDPASWERRPRWRSGRESRITASPPLSPRLAYPIKAWRDVSSGWERPAGILAWSTTTVQLTGGCAGNGHGRTRSGCWPRCSAPSLAGRSRLPIWGWPMITCRPERRCACP